MVYQLIGRARIAPRNAHAAAAAHVRRQVRPSARAYKMF
jgi:hypothetical protein